MGFMPSTWLVELRVLVVEAGQGAGKCLCDQLILRDPTTSRAEDAWSRGLCTHTGGGLRTGYGARSVGPCCGRTWKLEPDGSRDPSIAGLFSHRCRVVPSAYIKGVSPAETVRILSFPQPNTYVINA